MRCRSSFQAALCWEGQGVLAGGDKLQRKMVKLSSLPYPAFQYLFVISVFESWFSLLGSFLCCSLGCVLSLFKSNVISQVSFASSFTCALPVVFLLSSRGC